MFPETLYRYHTKIWVWNCFSRAQVRKILTINLQSPCLFVKRIIQVNQLYSLLSYRVFCIERERLLVRVKSLRKAAISLHCFCPCLDGKLDYLASVFLFFLSNEEKQFSPRGNKIWKRVERFHVEIQPWGNILEARLAWICIQRSLNKLHDFCGNISLLKFICTHEKEKGVKNATVRKRNKWQRKDMDKVRRSTQ